MITSIRFQNFKALRNATLPLGPFTLIVGPNGSGKTSALQAIEGMRKLQRSHEDLVSAGLDNPDREPVRVEFHWNWNSTPIVSFYQLQHNSGRLEGHKAVPEGVSENDLHRALRSIRIYSLVPEIVIQPSRLVPGVELGPAGENLAAILDGLRDHYPERFERLNVELGRWLPEFDRVLFSVPGEGMRAFALRTRDGHHEIPAPELSHGTVLALCLLTIASLPEPPMLVGIEEPDRGIHPRLLREVKDALYRLAYPAPEDQREPVQVVVTTHSPYFLDLFRDHPEEIVIANKSGLDVTFERLADTPHLSEILGEANLGDVWYSGILGGVPAQP
jgi:predicted ATPase